MSKARVLLFALLAAGAARAVPWPSFWADRFRGPDVKVRSVEGIDERIRDGKLYLTLKDFLALVLKNNTEIRVAQLDVRTASNAITAARAPFDPSVVLGFSSTRSESPQFTQIGGAESLNSLYQQTQAQLQQTLASGQTVSAGFTSSRNSSNNRFAYFNPSITTGLNISITQPLLQNRSNLRMKAPLTIARTQLLIATEQTEARIADMLAAAARQYWDAVQARDNIRVQQLSVDLAQKAYERDKLALDLGALSKLEIYQSQSQVAQRKVAVIQAQYAYRDALDGLRRLIGADIGPATRTIEIVLDDDPASLPAVPPRQTQEEALQAALDRRPELNSLRKRQGIEDLNAKVARDSMLPKLDLGVQVGAYGLGGNQVPVSGPLGDGPTAFVAGGLGDALHQMFGFRSPFYGFSLQLNVPVRTTQAQAALADALVNKTRAQYQQRTLEQQIIQEVKLAANGLEMASSQIDAARIARDLAQNNVDAQQQKYELGGITAFELLDAQNRLATVEGTLVGAYASYQKALIAYKRATWSLLDGMGIVVEK